MKTPTEFQIKQLLHEYDPVKAHQYYLRTRKLKGRKSGSADSKRPDFAGSLKVGAIKAKRKQDAKARQRKELAEAIRNLEDRLKKLEALIRTKQHEEAAENRKSKAKKERAAKEKDKPKSAAEKAKIARENKKYREKNQQKLKSDAKKRDGSSGGGSSSKTNKDSKSGPSVSDLKTLATRVRGQIAVAKQKLAAL